jgi:3-hydroxyacyl-[acyl-carrier-protein] dehydratase
MRWLWIDRFETLESGRHACAIKNVSLAEEHLHDHFPGYPIMPHSLLIEGMAQTAGILVGESKKFQEKVILAKISRAVFHSDVFPGDQIRHVADIVSVDTAFGRTEGKVYRLKDGDPFGELVAEIDLMFSHIDQNISGREFPKENFVFTDQFRQLIRSIEL